MKAGRSFRATGAVLAFLLSAVAGSSCAGPASAPQDGAGSGASGARAAPAGPAASEGDAVRSARTSAEAARAEFLERWARAYVPGRSGDIMLVPAEGHILTYTTPDVPFMHGSPWDYDARVPLILYGPGHIRAGEYDAPVAHEDLGATLSSLLRVPPWPGATGRPLVQALLPGEERPRLVVLVVLDAFRHDYPERFPEETSTVRRLRSEGAWFGEARVPYLPTATAVTHSSISTAAIPAVHGIVGNSLYDRRTGERVSAFPDGDPGYLMAPTVADRLAGETGGRALIAALGGTDYPAAALAGRGACQLGGHRTAVGFYDSGDPDGGWATHEGCYRLPAGLEGLAGRDRWEAVDGEWMGHPVADPFRFTTTALFARFEGDGLQSVLRAAPFGEDVIPDLLLVNWKALDRTSHGAGPFSAEARATLAEVDRQLAAFVDALEEKVGTGGFVLAVTADHGMPPEPAEPARRITFEELFESIQDRFDPGGPPLADRFGGADAQLTLDPARLAALEIEAEHVATHLERLPILEAAFAASEVSRAAARLAETP